MGLIMTVNDSFVKIEKVSFKKNQILPVPWLIDLPVDQNRFRYKNEKRKEKTKQWLPILKEIKQFN